MKAFIYSPVI